MPSSTVNEKDAFFSYDEVCRIPAVKNDSLPVLRGRVWGGDEKNQSWAVECESFEIFAAAVDRLGPKLQFLAFDELRLDEDTLHLINDDLERYATDQNLGFDTVAKAFSALRSHENEVFAVVSYAFLTSGQVFFIRAQNELARFVYHPDRLLSSEGISSVRKLKTLEQ